MLNTKAIMTHRILKHTLSFSVFLILFLSACTADKPPINENKMVDILVDMHITQSAKVRDNLNLRSWESYPYYNSVCEKHHVSRTALDSAISYYSKNETQYQLLYEKVIDELKRIETEVNSGIYAAESTKPTINSIGIDTVAFAIDTLISDSIITEIWPFKRVYLSSDTTTFRFDIKIREQKYQRYLLICTYKLLETDNALNPGFRAGVQYSDGSIKVKTIEFEKGQENEISMVFETNVTQFSTKLFFEFIDLSYRELKLNIDVNNIRLYKLYTEKVKKNQEKTITILETKDDNVLIEK